MSSSKASPRRSTILEVAYQAGVSKTSVSRYFSGERDRLSEAMQTRIASAAKRLNYRPNQMARGLKGGHSRLIGMLVADILNPFSVAVMHGVEQACRARGFSLVVCNTDNDPAQERDHLALLAAYRVEGLVINAAGQPSRELKQLAEQGTPLVLLDRSLGELEADEVGLDNARTIDMALDHLSSQGYGDLLYLSEPTSQASSRQIRLERFEQQRERRGLMGQAISLSLDKDASSLEKAITDFLASPSQRPKALLCANGNVTLAVTRALQAQGVMPGTIGLMGIDELDWCQLVTPGITTLAQPTKDIGRAAAETLLQRLESRGEAAPPRRIHYQPSLLARGSTQRHPTSTA